MKNPLQHVKTFSDLVDYLRDELDWPFEEEGFDNLTFEYSPDELGLKAEEAAAILEIKQLRPLRTNQPWGIFFVEFAPKKLPVVALRKILGGLVIKKRLSAKKGEQAAWKKNDLLFISRYGIDQDRQITLANFTDGATDRDLPTLKVLGWDELDTKLSLEHVHNVLKEKLHWPDDPRKTEEWKQKWSGAFVQRHQELINTTELLVAELAKLAKKIRERAKGVLAIETENGPLRKLFISIQKTLLHDLNEEGFTDMYAQTIAYGLFSAAVARAMSVESGASVQADNLVDMVPVTNPFLREMLAAFLTVSGRGQSLGFRRKLTGKKGGK